MGLTFVLILVCASVALLVMYFRWSDGVRDSYSDAEQKRRESDYYSLREQQKRVGPVNATSSSGGSFQNVRTFSTPVSATVPSSVSSTDSTTTYAAFAAINSAANDNVESDHRKYVDTTPALDYGSSSHDSGSPSSYDGGSSDSGGSDFGGSSGSFD